MQFRLQCNLCGEKSIAVESLPPSEKEGQALDEFRALHDQNCARMDAINFPEGAVSREAPVAHVGPFGSAKAPPVSVRKPHGHFTYTGPYGEQQEGDTLSCCHCRHHWQVRVGSGKTRGFCSKCVGYTCGKPECDACVPFARRIENIEAGRPVLTPGPIQASVPALTLSEYDRGPTGEAAADRRAAPEAGEDPRVGLAPGGPRRAGDGAEERVVLVG